MTKLIGIIGGAGAEGSYCADLLQKSDLEVAISDINIEKAKKLCAEKGYLLLSSEELMKSSSLALISLPIDVAPFEIQKLAPLAKGAIADLTSVKKRAMEAIINYSKPETEVFGVHIMCRPTISLRGQNVLMISGRPKKGGEWFNIIKKIMEKNKANVSVLESAEYHDEISALLQVLPHAVTYAYLTFLNKSLGGVIHNVHLDDLQKYSTLFSRLMMETTGRVVSDPKSGSMYGLIQSENPNTERVYEGLISILTTMKNWVKNRHIDSFAANHEELNKFLGWYAEMAAKKTDRMMGHPLGVEIYFERESGNKIIETLRPVSLDVRKYKEYLDTAIISDGELSKINRAFPLAKGVVHGVRKYKEGTTAFYLDNRHHPRHENKKIRFSPTVPQGLEDLNVEKLEKVNDLLNAILSSGEKSHEELSEKIKNGYEGIQAISKYLESLKRLKTINQKYERVQMFNRFSDSFLNLFDTWNRIDELSSLGHLVAYRVEK